MDLNKSREFFNPNKVKKQCHVIGCGSVGANIAELLARYGLTNITLWDFDTVEQHNIANQLFTSEDIGRKKTEALKDYLVKINPELNETLKLKGKYSSEILGGYVFCCVDSIECRQNIVKLNEYNRSIDSFYDFRTLLTEGQTYFADWSKKEDRQALKNSMNFTHEEAAKNAPVSACGFELSVSPVVKMVSIMGIANFTNRVNDKATKKVIICNPYDFNMLAM